MKYLFCLLILFAFACGDSTTHGSRMALDAGGNNFEAAESKHSNSEPLEVQRSDAQMVKKVIKTGDLSYQVKSVKETYREVTNLLDDFDAYVENENQSTYADRSQHSLTIRVPSDRFDSLFAALASQSEIIENRSIRLQDVTERYYDLETRLKNKKALEERYRELLEKANSVKEILEIERSLNEIRSEIEVAQGQFDYLSKQVNYSTIHLSFYEILPYQYQPESRPGFVERIKIALGGGWRLFVSFLFGLVRLWPFILVVVAGIILFRRYKKRKVKG